MRELRTGVKPSTTSCSLDIPRNATRRGDCRLSRATDEGGEGIVFEAKRWCWLLLGAAVPIF